jgi:hypothetical protein
MINVKKYNDKIDVSEKIIYEGIKFILSHFEKQPILFPRTIKTFDAKVPIKVECESPVQHSINKIFDIFKKSNYYDCKINCFAGDNNILKKYSTNFNNLKVKDKTISCFIMITLDLQSVSHNKEKLDNILNKTLNKLSVKFYGESHPTVLWTGNGYSIYQPLEGIIFENDKIFYESVLNMHSKIDPITEFTRFVVNFFTDGKIDPTYLPSVNSCFIRVPGTFNFKNGEQVKTIQKWDGKSPTVQWITYDFKNYLKQKKIDEIHKRKREIENKLFDYNQQQNQEDIFDKFKNL